MKGSSEIPDPGGWRLEPQVDAPLAVRSWSLSRQICNERRRPGLAAVRRVRFFKMVGIRGDIRPRSSYQDRPAVEAVLGEEFPAAVLELPDQRRYYDSTLAVGKRLTPLMRVGIVKKQG